MDGSTGTYEFDPFNQVGVMVPLQYVELNGNGDSMVARWRAVASPFPQATSSAHRP